MSEVLPKRPGSLRLFSAFNIHVFVHWTWLVAAIILYSVYQNAGGNPLWFVLTYLVLFVIVTMHEFGHALACRSVGGEADTIVLWPLGGVAYVSPPARPGAVLWAIAAGPLVNLVLVPVTMALYFLAASVSASLGLPGFEQFAMWVMAINAMLLIFNMLPIYPLDGGQILQAILWFFMGRAKSLQVAATIGVVGGIVLGLGMFILEGSIWILLIGVFIVMQSVNGLRVARVLAQYERQQQRYRPGETLDPHRQQQQQRQQQRATQQAWRPVHPHEVMGNMKRISSVSRPSQQQD